MLDKLVISHILNANLVKHCGVNLRQIKYINHKSYQIPERALHGYQEYLSSCQNTRGTKAMIYEVKTVIKSTLALLCSLIQVPARNWCMLDDVTEAS